MQQHERGELALQFGFNKDKELEITKYLLPRGEKFTATEIQEAYVSASTSAPAMKQDIPASALFAEFHQGVKRDPRKHRKPHKYNVFTWSQTGEPESRTSQSSTYRGNQPGESIRTTHVFEQEIRCACCHSADFISPGTETLETQEQLLISEPLSVFAGKKYKPVGLKVRPVYTELPEKYRIKREIKGDPLKDMPGLSPNPRDYCPTGRYDDIRKELIDKLHSGEFLWPEERKLLHEFMMVQNLAFAWEDSERGTFRHDFFPPVEFPVVEHNTWVERSIPIPRGQLEEFCKVIKNKIDAGVYEPSNTSYRSKFFGVVKKDGKSIRLVHALEPLNAVTIAHSGVPPATDELANHFAGRACGGVLDLYSGYDHRDIAENSRDFTTFQTPFGALRLVKLPQGWTNSVPIFHDDVTYILRDEIPHVTIPYIDDVPIRGPGTRYERPDGTFETIPENPGIRRFVWEHFQNLNRVVQRIKYCGGTLSGPKSILCADSFAVVGHICSWAGRRPDTDRIGVIMRWPPLKDPSEVRQFNGTVGVMRMFIERYGQIAEPWLKLVRKGVEWVWGKEQQDTFDAIKQAVANAPNLRPLNYDWDSDTFLAVDTSWKSVGYQVYQEDPVIKKTKYYAKFGSIGLNEREARFSQPKRELYGVKRALEALQYWLLGCRRLVVETDALYIKGMLANPGMGPSATINRWIEQILMFHFKLKHVKGANFPPDGLSRRDPQPGDEEYPNNEIGLDENPSPENHSEWDYSIPQPLAFDEFKEGIDERGGYFQSMEGTAGSIKDFDDELLVAYDQEQVFMTKVADAYASEGLVMPQYITNQILPEEMLLPDIALRDDPAKREPYIEKHRTNAGINQDERLKLVIPWLNDPFVRPEGMESDKAYKSFIRFCRPFFVSKDGKLYKRGEGSTHKLVVAKEHRMYMMRASHNSLGHRGQYATKSIIELRFWWPEMERDIKWFVDTCHVCQLRQKTLLKVPPVATMTPSIFQKIHTDVMIMGTPSNNYKHVVASRDSLSRYLEARPIKADDGEHLGKFLLEDIICRWGCPQWIITDNAPQFILALKWLNTKYGIIGIRISAYNSKANGPVERGHWDMRQSLYKATGGDVKKWYWFFPQVLWADRITVRRGLGCSPYFAVCGAHPITPLDIEEATWLVEYPDRALTTAELIGLRARALAKHSFHIDEMRSRVDEEKRKAVRRYEEENKATIKDYNFKPGSLVLIRNTTVENSLNTKMGTRYAGPMVVVRRTVGGSYLCCELDGAMFQGKIAQFRVIPFEQRKEIKLPDGILKLIDLSKEEVDKLAEEDEAREEYVGKDLQFHKIRIRPKEVEGEEDSDSDSESYMSEEVPDLDLDELRARWDPSQGPRKSKRLQTGKTTKKAG